MARQKSSNVNGAPVIASQSAPPIITPLCSPKVSRGTGWYWSDHSQNRVFAECAGSPSVASDRSNVSSPM